MAFEAITLHAPDDRGDPRTKRSYPRAACRWAAIRACAADPHASFVVRRSSRLVPSHMPRASFVGAPRSASQPGPRSSGHRYASSRERA
ncbi:hypothetical protein DR62_07700 [Burkholderia thailandensis]|nr:hypothetical protein DR62_07700 [Burkholderia thailandensis]AOI55295.1 hypothetical protein WI24_26470 [Burkholderia thailandensis]AOJ54325.1 hypothetical protein AQ475_26625 [Burkholderia thailandensis]